MAQITFTISDDKIDDIKKAMKGLFPIPMIKDKFGNETPQFTDNQWAKESIRRWIINCVHRYKLKLAQDAISVPPDDTLIT